jgi:putative ABC transport system permease protein
VSAAKPLWITIHNWRKLPTEAESQSSEFETQYLPIAVMAFATQDDVFKLEAVESQQSLLNSGHEVLLDQSTQRDYGPWDGRKFDVPDIGRQSEIGGQTFSIGGVFNLGTGLAANGAAITSQHGFARIIPWDVERQTSLGLIDIETAADVDEVVAELRMRFQVGEEADESLAVDVMSRAEAMERERFRWLRQTPIGLIFQLGVAISLLVGAAIVYMVLATDVANRLPEYATLLAMGYSRRYLSSIVMTQAIALCLLGFVVSWGAAELLYRLTSHLSGIPVEMNTNRIVYVLGMGLAMSCCSGLLALRKLWKAEPASLF